MSAPTEAEVRTEAERLHAAECYEGCHLPISASWLSYARQRLERQMRGGGQ